MIAQKRMQAEEQTEERRHNGLVSFGADVRRLVAPVLGKNGFLHADILTHWDDIEPTLMHGDSFQGRLSRSVIIEDRVKDTMAAMGFMELYNYNFTSPQEYDLLLIPENDEKRNTVRLQNPFGEDQSLMRTTLIGGLLRTMRTNCNKKSGHGRFFEIGNVHFNNPDLPEERKMLGIIAYGGAGNVRNAENFFTLKGIIEKLFEILGIENARFERGGGAYLHPGQKAVVSIDGEVIGEMGCTHPRFLKNFGKSPFHQHRHRSVFRKRLFRRHDFGYFRRQPEFV